MKNSRTNTPIKKTKKQQTPTKNPTLHDSEFPNLHTSETNSANLAFSNQFMYDQSRASEQNIWNQKAPNSNFSEKSSSKAPSFTPYREHSFDQIFATKQRQKILKFEGRGAAFDPKLEKWPKNTKTPVTILSQPDVLKQKLMQEQLDNQLLNNLLVQQRCLMAQMSQLGFRGIMLLPKNEQEEEPQGGSEPGDKILQIPEIPIPRKEPKIEEIKEEEVEIISNDEIKHFQSKLNKIEEKKIAKSTKKRKTKIKRSRSRILEGLCYCQFSKCLKLYCECFKHGKYCKDECNCLNCNNKEEYHRKFVPGLTDNEYLKELAKIEYLVHAKNKYSRKSKDIGCKCVKSHCQKKYCACYVSGKKCSDFCLCKRCKNQPAPNFENKEESEVATTKGDDENGDGKGRVGVERNNGGCLKKRAPEGGVL